MSQPRRPAANLALWLLFATVVHLYDHMPLLVPGFNAPVGLGNLIHFWRPHPGTKPLSRAPGEGLGLGPLRRNHAQQSYLTPSVYGSSVSISHVSVALAPVVTAGGCETRLLGDVRH